MEGERVWKGGACGGWRTRGDETTWGENGTPATHPRRIRAGGETHVQGGHHDLEHLVSVDALPPGEHLPEAIGGMGQRASGARRSGDARQGLDRGDRVEMSSVSARRVARVPRRRPLLAVDPRQRQRRRRYRRVVIRRSDGRGRARALLRLALRHRECEPRPLDERRRRSTKSIGRRASHFVRPATTTWRSDENLPGKAVWKLWARPFFWSGKLCREEDHEKKNPATWKRKRDPIPPTHVIGSTLVCWRVSRTGCRSVVVKKRRATSATPEAAPHTHPRQTARDERRTCREANESREFLARHPAGRSRRPRRSSLRRRQCARRAEPPRATRPTPGRRRSTAWTRRRARRARRDRIRSRSPSRPPRWCVRRPHDSRARRDARTPAANLVVHFFSGKARV